MIIHGKMSFNIMELLKSNSVKKRAHTNCDAGAGFILNRSSNSHMKTRIIDYLKEQTLLEEDPHAYSQPDAAIKIHPPPIQRFFVLMMHDFEWTDRK